MTRVQRMKRAVFFTNDNETLHKATTKHIENYYELTKDENDRIQEHLKLEEERSFAKHTNSYYSI